MRDNVLKSSGLVMLNATNYNRWQYEQLRPFVGKTVLEIGCGLGNLTQYLLTDARFLLSVDTRPEAVAFLRERCPSGEHFCVEQRDVFTDGLGPYSQRPFDTIVFSNVLEHIEDDLGAVKKCYEILKPQQGKLLLLVPAHSFLYGTLDEEAGHFRRYSKQAIRDLAGAAGFSIVDLYAFNAVGALGWYVNYCLFKRRGSNNSSQDGQVDLYDRYLVRPGRFLEKAVRPPIGISYIAILEAA